MSKGNLSCRVYAGKNAYGDVFWMCKDRIKVTQPKTSESDGCRLWFMILFKGEKAHYFRILLYEAQEEKNYPKSICLKVIKERLDLIGL